MLSSGTCAILVAAPNAADGASAAMPPTVAAANSATEVKSAFMVIPIKSTTGRGGGSGVDQHHGLVHHIAAARAENARGDQVVQLRFGAEVGRVAGQVGTERRRRRHRRLGHALHAVV